MNNDGPCIIDIECDYPCEEFFDGEICPCLRANGMTLEMIERQGSEDEVDDDD